jgi:Polyketide cyclase / dehydrase and lipid transport
MTRIEAEHRFGVALRDGYDYITDQAHWPEYWPGFVRLEPGSRWSEPGDVTRIVVRLLGRAVPLEMTIRRIEPYRLVEYTSVQPGLPAVRHERHFTEAGDGFHYRLVVEYEPRRGLRGPYDRLLVRRAIERAMRRTIANLEATLGSRQLVP